MKSLIGSLFNKTEKNSAGKKAEEKSNEAIKKQEASSSKGKGDVQPVLNEFDGTIAYINDQFIITPPKEGGKPASLQSDDPKIEVILNNLPLIGSADIFPGDKIEIKFNNKEPQRSLKVKVQPDEMAAYLEPAFTMGERVFLQPAAPTDFLILKPEAEILIAEPWTAADIEAELAKAGVISGIDQEALDLAVTPVPPSILKIASAVKPIPGIDAYIEYKFPQDAVLPTVDKNQLIAVKHPIEPGTPGMTVKGTLIPVEDAMDCELVVGDGAILSASGMEAVAAFGGRPIIKGDALCVEEQYVIDKDVTSVNFPEGIDFKGNLIINKVVEDSPPLKIGGDFLANDHIINAVVMVGGSAEVTKNLISSKLYSGRVHLAYKSILKSTQKLQVQSKSLIDSALQLKSRILAEKKELNENKIINLLITSRYKDFFENIINISENYKIVENIVEGKVKKLFNDVTFCLNNTAAINIRTLAGIYNASVGLLKEVSRVNSSNDSKVVCRYAQNSRIEANGDIIINGSGCYNSELVSKGNIEISGSLGIFRGGRAVAEGNITMKELGCPSSATPTYVDVPGDKKITVGLIHAGVVLRVGGRVYRNMEDHREFEIYLDDEGALQTIALKANPKADDRWG